MSPPKRSASPVGASKASTRKKPPAAAPSPNDRSRPAKKVSNPALDDPEPAASSFIEALAELLRSRNLEIPPGLLEAPPEAYAGQSEAVVQTMARLKDEDLEERASKMSGNPTFGSMAKSFEDQLTNVEDSIYQTKNQSGEDPLNFPIRINNQMAALLGFVENGEPARPARAGPADPGGGGLVLPQEAPGRVDRRGAERGRRHLGPPGFGGPQLACHHNGTVPLPMP